MTARWDQRLATRALPDWPMDARQARLEPRPDGALCLRGIAWWTAVARASPRPEARIAVTGPELRAVHGALTGEWADASGWHAARRRPAAAPAPVGGARAGATNGR